MPMSRRFFLKEAGMVAAYVGLSPVDTFSQMQGWGLRPVPVKKGKTLVVLFLRGGADGLNMVVPYGDPHYYGLRNALALPRPGEDDGVLDLDGFFGIHPRMGKLHSLLKSGVAVAAHAVGYSRNTRSHFEEQDVWETGVVGNTLDSDGWLNRHLRTSEGRGPIRAVAIGSTLPRILRGDAAAYALRGISDLTLPDARGDADVVAGALEHAYVTGVGENLDPARELLRRTARTTLEGIRALRGIGLEPYSPRAEYPDTELAGRLREVARLVKADVGLEVAEVDFGGWDTHQNQGNRAGGALGNLVQTLSDGVSAFCEDLGERLDDVLILTLSDFGRTAAENGTRGTDHGWGNCMFCLGGAVARADRDRPVVTRWPGLGPEELHQNRDLLHTTDFRDVLGEVVRTHLGNPRLETVLPGHTFQKVGLVG